MPYRLINEREIDIVKLKQSIYRHDSGLLVVITQTHGPLFSFKCVVPTFPEDDLGLPHCLEHLIFFGSKQTPHPKFLETVATSSFMDGTNAYTAEDHTAYTAVAAGEEGLLRLTPLFLEHIFNPDLPLSALYTEVYHKEESGDGGVIYCEVKGTEESEEDRQSIALHSLLFPHSPYSRNCGGYSCLLKNVDIAKLKAFHEKFYRPECATLIFTGGYDEKKVLAAVEAARCFHNDFPKSASGKFDGSFSDKSNTPLAMLLQNVAPLAQSVTQSVPFLAEDEAVGSVRIGYPLPFIPLNRCSSNYQQNTEEGKTKTGVTVVNNEQNVVNTEEQENQLDANGIYNATINHAHGIEKNKPANETSKLYDSALQSHSVFLLSKYLEESASSPLRERFVEREHPLCSDLAVDIMPFLHNVIEVSFDGVPMDQDEVEDSDYDDDGTEGVDGREDGAKEESKQASKSKQKSLHKDDHLKGAHLRRQLHALLRHLLERQAFGKGTAPSAVMAKIVEQSRMRLVEAFEDQPHDVIDERVTADCLFVDHNDDEQCHCIGESLSFNKYLDYLAQQPPSYWESLLSKCFILNHYAEVITVPQLDSLPISMQLGSKDRAEQTSKEKQQKEQQQLQKQKQTSNNGKQQNQVVEQKSELTSAEWKRLLDAAVLENEREMPKSLSDLIPPLPDISAIPLHRLRVRVDPSNGLRGYALHDIEAETRLYSHRLFFDIRALPVRLRPLLLLFQEMVLTSDVTIDDYECIKMIEKWRDQKRESEGKKKRKKAGNAATSCCVPSACEAPTSTCDAHNEASSLGESASNLQKKNGTSTKMLPTSKSCPVSGEMPHAAIPTSTSVSRNITTSLSHSELATFLNDVFATAECSVGFGNAGFGCVTMPHLLSLWFVGDESATRLSVRLFHAILRGARFTTKRLETVRAALSGSLCESLREPDCVCTAIESIVLGAAEVAGDNHLGDGSNNASCGGSHSARKDCNNADEQNDAVRLQTAKKGAGTDVKVQGKKEKGTEEPITPMVDAEVNATAAATTTDTSCSNNGSTVCLLQPRTGEKSVSLTLSQCLSGAVQRMVLETPLPQAVHGLDEIRQYLLSDSIPICLQRVVPRHDTVCGRTADEPTASVAFSEVGLDPFIRNSKREHQTAPMPAPTAKESGAASSVASSTVDGGRVTVSPTQGATSASGEAAAPRFTFTAPKRGALCPRAVLCGIAGVEVGVLSLHTPCAVKRGTREGRAVACLCEVLSRSGGPLTAAVRGAGAAYGASVYHNESAGVLTFAADRCRDAAEAITRFRGVLEDVAARPDEYCSSEQLSCAVSTLVLAAAQRRGTVTCTAAEGFRSFSDGDTDYQQTIDVRSVMAADVMEVYRTYFTGFLRRGSSTTLCCVVDSRCAKREAQRLSDVLGVPVQPHSVNALCGRRERLELFAERRHKKSKGKNKNANEKGQHAKDKRKTKGKKK